MTDAERVALGYRGSVAETERQERDSTERTYRLWTYENQYGSIRVLVIEDEIYKEDVEHVEQYLTDQDKEITERGKITVSGEASFWLPDVFRTEE